MGFTNTAANAESSDASVSLKNFLLVISTNLEEIAASTSLEQCQAKAQFLNGFLLTATENYHFVVPAEKEEAGAGETVIKFWLSNAAGSQAVSTENLAAAFNSLAPNRQAWYRVLIQDKVDSQGGATARAFDWCCQPQPGRTVTIEDVQIVEREEAAQQQPRRSSRTRFPSIWTRCLICEE
jgi:hypothetical protein